MELAGWLLSGSRREDAWLALLLLLLLLCGDWERGASIERRRGLARGGGRRLRAVARGRGTRVYRSARPVTFNASASLSHALVPSLRAPPPSPRSLSLSCTDVLSAPSRERRELPSLGRTPSTNTQSRRAQRVLALSTRQRNMQAPLKLPPAASGRAPRRRAAATGVVVAPPLVASQPQAPTTTSERRRPRVAARAGLLEAVLKPITTAGQVRKREIAMWGSALSCLFATPPRVGAPGSAHASAALALAPFALTALLKNPHHADQGPQEGHRRLLRRVVGAVGGRLGQRAYAPRVRETERETERERERRR
jgi:hypothetical protein